MNARTLALLLAGLLAAAPAGAQQKQAPKPPPPSNSFRYDPPGDPPPGGSERYVDLPPDNALPLIEKALRAQKLKVERVDKAKRTIVARYSGDGRKFVDCGSAEMLTNGRRDRPPKLYSANRPDARTYRETRGRRVGLYRELVLDARLVVQAAPSGKGTEIKSEALYVTTKSVYHVMKGGELGMLADREIISFSSGEAGRFDKGTRCIATGRLETLAGSGLKGT